MSKFALSYLLGGAGLIGLYAASEVFGWETDSPTTHTKMDPSVRQSPGGWRSFTFWHQGIHGGK